MDAANSSLLTTSLNAAWNGWSRTDKANFAAYKKRIENAVYEPVWVLNRKVELASNHVISERNSKGLGHFEDSRHLRSRRQCREGPDPCDPYRRLGNFLRLPELCHSSWAPASGGKRMYAVHDDDHKREHNNHRDYYDNTPRGFVHRYPGSGNVDICRGGYPTVRQFTCI